MTRTELIHSLTQANTEKGELISKSVRGNTLWTLWQKEEPYIIAYQLVRVPEGWTHTEEFEETPPQTYTCPKKYLNAAPIKCEHWRDKIQEYNKKKKNNKTLIRELFKNKGKDEKLQVTIKAKEGYAIHLHRFILEEAELDIVSVYPGIEGRFQRNGLRYKIPLRLVTDMKILKRDE